MLLPAQSANYLRTLDIHLLNLAVWVKAEPTPRPDTSLFQFLQFWQRM